MKQIPGKLADPEYVVIRPDGRINAILEMRKKNRPILISVEMEAFLTTTQEKQQDDDTYNLIVTILDARKNYLKNNVFANSRIVENKNTEDPAHFISRLKLSQNATMPTNDHAEPSQKYDTTSSGKVNPPAEGKHSFEIGAARLASPTEAEYARELAQIHRMDPEMGSLKDVLNSAAGTRFREYIGKGPHLPGGVHPGGPGEADGPGGRKGCPGRERKFAVAFPRPP